MLNNLCYQGRFTKDPILRSTTGGISVLSGTIAWSEKIKDRETKCFLDCIFWGKTAETVHTYFKKGDQIIITGKLKTESWDGKDGVKHWATKCSVLSFSFCGSKKTDSAPQQASTDNHGVPPVEDFPEENAPPPEGPDQGDSIPF